MTLATQTPKASLRRARFAFEFPGWLEALLGFIYPPVCQLCGVGLAGAGDGSVCRR